jgi:hypothetical protein
MDFTSMVINVAALTCSFGALATSFVMAMRQVNTAHKANQVPVTFEIFRIMRSNEIRKREETVHAQLPRHKPELGFSNLPEPLHGYAHEVSSYYNMIGYLAMMRVVDRRVATLPLYHRARKTWSVVQPYVQAEREIRNDPLSFMHGFEALIQKIDEMDIKREMAKMKKNISD